MNYEITEFTEEKEWPEEPEECDHPVEEQLEVVDSTGTVVTIHQSFMECQLCGAKVDITEEETQELIEEDNEDEEAENDEE